MSRFDKYTAKHDRDVIGAVEAEGGHVTTVKELRKELKKYRKDAKVVFIGQNGQDVVLSVYSNDTGSVVYVDIGDEND